MLMQWLHDNMLCSINCLCNTTGCFFFFSPFLKSTEHLNISDWEKWCFWRGNRQNNRKKEKVLFTEKQKIGSQVALQCFYLKDQNRSYTLGLRRNEFDRLGPVTSCQWTTSKHGTYIHSLVQLTVLCSRQFLSGANMKINGLLSPGRSVPQWGKTIRAHKHAAALLLFLTITNRSRSLSFPVVRYGHYMNQDIIIAGAKCVGNP